MINLQHDTTRFKLQVFLLPVGLMVTWFIVLSVLSWGNNSIWWTLMFPVSGFLTVIWVKSLLIKYRRKVFTENMRRIDMAFEHLQQLAGKRNEEEKV